MNGKQVRDSPKWRRKNQIAFSRKSQQSTKIASILTGSKFLPAASVDKVRTRADRQQIAGVQDHGRIIACRKKTFGGPETLI